MVIRTWTWAALGLLTAYGLQRAARSVKQRRLATQSQHGEATRVWEGEGGAVPVSPHRTAGAVTPSAMTGTAYPESDHTSS